MFGKKNEQKPDLEMFVMFDSKVASYELPFFARSRDDLCREVLNNMRNDAKDPKCQNKFFLNAEDFSIFKIGEYRRSTGEITPNNAEHVVNLHELKTLAMPTSTGALLPT